MLKRFAEMTIAQQKLIENKLDLAKKILLKVLRKEGHDLQFFIVKNKEMEKLRSALVAREDFNGKEARKIASEEIVNVLAFPEPNGFPHPESGKKMLGEIYLNGEYVPLGGELDHFRTESSFEIGQLDSRSKAGMTKRPEAGSFEVLGPLFIHGFLHLLGYLHWTKRDTIKMQNLEKKLWAHISSLD